MFVNRDASFEQVDIAFVDLIICLFSYLFCLLKKLLVMGTEYTWFLLWSFFFSPLLTISLFGIGNIQAALRLPFLIPVGGWARVENY